MNNMRNLTHQRSDTRRNIWNTYIGSLCSSFSITAGCVLTYELKKELIKHLCDGTYQRLSPLGVHLNNNTRYE